MKMTQYREGQHVRVTNEYGETFDWTIAVIQPTTSGAHRLTLSRPSPTDASQTWYCKAYTNDPETIIEIIQDAAEHAPQKTVEAPTSKPTPALPALLDGVFGYSLEQIEAMQGQGKGTLCR